MRKRALILLAILFFASFLLGGLAHAEATYTASLSVGESVILQHATVHITLNVTRNDTALSYSGYQINITKDGNTFRENWSGIGFVDTEDNAQGHTYLVTGLHDTELNETVDFSTTTLDIVWQPAGSGGSGGSVEVNDTQDSKVQSEGLKPLDVVGLQPPSYDDISELPYNSILMATVIFLISIVIVSTIFYVNPKPKRKTEPRALFDSVRCD
jgi:hypothetical protein